MHSNLLEPASVGTQRKLILHNLLARPDTTIQYEIVDCTDIELRVRVPTNIRLDTRGLIFAAIYSKSVLPVILSSICLFLRHAVEHQGSSQEYSSRPSHQCPERRA